MMWYSIHTAVKYEEREANQETMTVADLLQNEYQSWKKGIYLVNAPTGTGKTQFVLNQLYDYAQSNNKKIAMFVNRTILRDQLLENLQSKDIYIATYQKLEFNNYLQRIIYTMPLTYDLENLSAKVNQYDYLILDEAHYLFQDASFNSNTDVIMELVKQFQGIVLFLTATPQLLKAFYKDKILREYVIEPDYSYIQKTILFDSDKELQKIIAGIPPTDKILYFGGNKENLRQYREFFSNSDFLCRENKNTNQSARQIVETNQFQCRILFATKVLENGINLIDKNLKHIFIDLDDLITAIQCIGRKRIVGQETITLYIRNKTKHSFTLKWNKLKEQMRIYYDLCSMPEENFAEKYQRSELPNFLDNNFHIIRPALFYSQQRYQFVASIMDGSTSFIEELMKLLPNCSPENYREISLTQYLQENQNKRFYAKEKEIIIQTINLRQNGILKKSITVLNAFLRAENIPFEIVAQRDLERQSPQFRKTYWEICSKN